MFTQKEIREILKNKNVIKCTTVYITYSEEFKIQSVKKYLKKGYSARTIFKQAGFDIGIIGKERAEQAMSRWRRIYRIKGEKGLIEKPKGRKKKVIRTKDQEIEYLKLKIKYMEEESSFLAKL